MGRTGWLAVVVLCACVVGAVARWSWPSAKPSLPCAPDRVIWMDAGTGRIARCAPAAAAGDAGVPVGAEPLPAGMALTVGRKLDLQTASAQDLALLKGIGPSLAHALVEARAKNGGFHSWAEVDAVRGIGPSKLAVLKAQSRL